jgi:hypothetical protein
MEKLTREDLYSLEDYAERRTEFRARVMDHKRPRRIVIGAHAAFYFEDRLTMHYQVQEMLRAERIFEKSGINEELQVYNPLIPDGSNWKATLMLEYTDVAERQQALARLQGIEDRCWVRVGDEQRVYAIADEDLERADENKTSSVHFLRFELTPAMVKAVKTGAPIAMGIDHPEYQARVDPIPESSHMALAADLD